MDGNPCVAHDQPGEQKLSLIGRERFMIEKLAKALHGEARRHGSYTPVREIRRGNEFEVLLDDGRVAKITVVLDRVMPNEEREN